MKTPWKLCAASDCEVKFKPRKRSQLYCSLRCKNREAQRRLVRRAQGRRSQPGPLPTAKKPVPGGEHHSRPKASPQGRETPAMGILESGSDNPLESLVNAFIRQQGLDDE